MKSLHDRIVERYTRKVLDEVVSDPTLHKDLAWGLETVLAQEGIGKVELVPPKVKLRDLVDWNYIAHFAEQNGASVKLAGSCKGALRNQFSWNLGTDAVTYQKVKKYILSKVGDEVVPDDEVRLPGLRQLGPLRMIVLYSAFHSLGVEIFSNGYTAAELDISRNNAGS